MTEAALLAAPPAVDREALRARVFLRAVLPLLETVFVERPRVSEPFRGVTATVEVRVAGSDLAAALVFEGGRLSVLQGANDRATVSAVFRDLAALNTFFAGKPVLPKIVGLRHPLLIFRVARLLLELRILAPGKPPARAEDRALRVKLLLCLVTRALAELHRGGYEPMVDLVASSPERVYQWTVEKEGLGAYVRMERGRIKAGRGTYMRRRPFVHFIFPHVDAALEVLTATGSQMDLVRDGSVRTLGSPEYTRKISLLMQKVDELLQEG